VLKKPLSLRAYARSRGLSHTAVQRAVRERRLVRSLTLDERGVAKIGDPKLADEEWSAFTRARLHQQGLLENTGAGTQLRVNPEQFDYQKARAAREHYEAELKRLEYETAVRQLLNAEEVKLRTFKAARQARDALLSIPDRMAPVLAAETNAFEVHRILTDELRRVCDNLADDAAAIPR
jgi:hypothetical protein